MSRIASFDWPNDWPELFTLLIQALHSMNANIIHGAMRVFTGKTNIFNTPFFKKYVQFHLPDLQASGVGWSNFCSVFFKANLLNGFTLSFFLINLKRFFVRL